MICPLCKKEFNYTPIRSQIHEGTLLCLECGISDALVKMGWADDLNRDAKEKDDYIHDLEEENENLSEENRNLIETLKGNKNGKLI